MSQVSNYSASSQRKKSTHKIIKPICSRYLPAKKSCSIKKYSLVFQTEIWSDANKKMFSYFTLQAKSVKKLTAATRNPTNIYNIYIRIYSQHVLPKHRQKTPPNITVTEGFKEGLHRGPPFCRAKRFCNQAPGR